MYTMQNKKPLCLLGASHVKYFWRTGPNKTHWTCKNIYKLGKKSEAQKALRIKLLLKITQPDIEMKLPQLC